MQCIAHHYIYQLTFLIKVTDFALAAAEWQIRSFYMQPSKNNLLHIHIVLSVVCWFFSPWQIHTFLLFL